MPLSVMSRCGRLRPRSFIAAARKKEFHATRVERSLSALFSATYLLRSSRSFSLRPQWMAQHQCRLRLSARLC
jgi:hypothetical protein